MVTHLKIEQTLSTHTCISVCGTHSKWPLPKPLVQRPFKQQKKEEEKSTLRVMHRLNVPNAHYDNFVTTGRNRFLPTLQIDFRTF